MKLRWNKLKQSLKCMVGRHHWAEGMTFERKWLMCFPGCGKRVDIE